MTLPTKADDWRSRVYRSGGITGTRRGRPSAVLRKQMLAKQGHRCLYCDLLFSGTVMRHGRPVVLRLVWDHFVPYAYLVRNPSDNWVAACHVCNAIKGSLMFETV